MNNAWYKSCTLRGNLESVQKPNVTDKQINVVMKVEKM